MVIFSQIFKGFVWIIVSKICSVLVHIYSFYTITIGIKLEKWRKGWGNLRGLKRKSQNDFLASYPVFLYDFLAFLCVL